MERDFELRTCSTRDWNVQRMRELFHRRPIRFDAPIRKLRYCETRNCRLVHCTNTVIVELDSTVLTVLDSWSCRDTVNVCKSGQLGYPCIQFSVTGVRVLSATTDCIYVLLSCDERVEDGFDVHFAVPGDEFQYEGICHE